MKGTSQRIYANKAVSRSEEYITNRDTLIKDLIQEFIDDKRTEKKYQQQQQLWRMQNDKVSVSNWLKDQRYNYLFKKINLLKQTILQCIQVNEMQKEELTVLSTQLTQKEDNEWNNVQSEIAMYNQNFSYAQKEYSTENLERNIEICDNESRRLYEEIEIAKSTLNNLRMISNPYNMEVNLIFTNASALVDYIRNDNMKKLRAIQSAKDTLHCIRNKVTQSDIAILEYKKKEKMNEQNCVF